MFKDMYRTFSVIYIYNEVHFHCPEHFFLKTEFDFMEY